MDWFLYDNGLRRGRVKEKVQGVYNQNQRLNHIITSCKKLKKIRPNLTNLYFISATFRMYSFSPFLSFKDDKIKVQVLQ